MTNAAPGAGARLGAGLVHLLTGRGITLAAQFVTLAVAARALGPSPFGVVQLGVSIFVYVGFVNDLGLTLLGAREVGGGASKATGGDLIGMRIALTAVALLPILVVLLLAPLDASQRTVAGILSLGFVLSALNMRWLFQAREQFRRIALADTIGAGVQLVLTVLTVQDPSDIAWAAVAVISGPATSTALMLVLSPRDASLVPSFGRRGLYLVRRAMPLGIATIATAVYYSLDSLLLGVFRGTTEVGYYAAAYRIVLACLTLAYVAHSAALPIVSKMVREEPTVLPAVLRPLARYLLLFMLPIAVGTTLCSDTIVRLVFGDAFLQAAAPLQVLIWTCVTVSANVPFAVLMLARGMDRRYMGTTILGAVANTGTNLVMIPLFGTMGAAVTTIAAELLVLAVILWSTRDVSGPVVASAARAAIPPTIVMAIVLVPVRESLAAIPLGMVTFALAALALRVVRMADLRSFSAALAGRSAEWNT